MNYQVLIDEETLQDIINIETGLLFPLDGFMRKKDFDSVVEHYTLADGQVFPIPITLDIPEKIYSSLTGTEAIDLVVGEECVARIWAESKFQITDDDIEKIFSTSEDGHPGVNKEKKRSIFRVGGKTKLLKKELLTDALQPEKTKRIFREKGWKTVVGFQTRNPIHKAHEHIQRLGLEICDGLFVNPIIGWKKREIFRKRLLWQLIKECFVNFIRQKECICLV